MVTQQVQAADSTWFIPIPRDQDERSLDSGQPYDVLEFFGLSRWRLEVRFDHGATPRRQDDVGTLTDGHGLFDNPAKPRRFQKQQRQLWTLSLTCSISCAPPQIHI